MPNYGSGALGVATQLFPGDLYYLFNGESPTAPQASIAIATAFAPNGDAGFLFQIFFAAAPTSALVIQASNIDQDALYQTVYTSTNKQQDAYIDTDRWQFYRAKLISQSAGGVVTVVVKR
jgi:hypothetical protein